MTHAVTGKRITIKGRPGEAFGLSLPAALLDKFRALLEANNVPHWVDDEFLSIDGGPETAFITFSLKADRVLVQDLLDSIP